MTSSQSRPAGTAPGTTTTRPMGACTPGPRTTSPSGTSRSITAAASNQFIVFPPRICSKGNTVNTDSLPTGPSPPATSALSGTAACCLLFMLPCALSTTSSQPKAASRSDRRCQGASRTLSSRTCVCTMGRTGFTSRPASPCLGGGLSDNSVTRTLSNRESARGHCWVASSACSRGCRLLPPPPSKRGHT